jgi:hypothetical protein
LRIVEVEVGQGVDVALGVEAEQVDLAKTGKSLNNNYFMMQNWTLQKSQ